MEVDVVQVAGVHLQVVLCEEELGLVDGEGVSAPSKDIQGLLHLLP